MLFTISALAVAATISALHQSAPMSRAASARPPIHPSHVAVTSRDSLRALRLAHRAQGDFESLRRQLLPYATLTGAVGCDAVVGHYCYVQQVASAPPREAPVVVSARTRLLAILDSLGVMIPGDRWIAGQKVRYLIEAGRPRAADSTAIACAARAAAAATKSWCFALVGYTAQQFGHFGRANAAFTYALAAMTRSERAMWENLALLLGRRAAGPYREADGAARDSMTAAFWRLVQPLYLRDVNDLRTEFLARVTRMYMERGSQTAMSERWRSDDRDALLRYGVALWYTQGVVRRGAMGPPEVAGIRRVPAFNFFPDEDTFEQPGLLAADDWALWNVESRPAYAPLWASSFQPIVDHQVALFRRGDSALIVAAFAVNDDAALGRARQAGVFAATVEPGGVHPPVGTTIEHAGLSVVSTLMAPWRPMIVSLEVLDSADGAAGRVRFAPRLPASDGRPGLSDLLLYAPRDSAAASLADVLPFALRATQAPSNRQLGVFWEAYGLRSDGEPLDYRLTVTRIDRGLIRRTLVRWNLKDPDRGLDLRWREEPTVVGGIASRGMTVDLSRLEPGRYRVQLTLSSGSDLPVVAEREIDIL